MKIKSISVFCGSSTGLRKEYTEAARRLGHVLAKRNICVINGAGGVGLMNELSNAVLDAGGRVIGVITKLLLNMKVAHLGLTELEVVETMHERKALMAELSDGFIALPGGIGTLEELIEMFTWSQLGIHRKPCGILNVRDYFRPLMQLIDQAVSEGFLKAEHAAVLQQAETPESLLEKLENCTIPNVKKYIDLKVI